MISSIILTLNEEDVLCNCLESLNWCDDIHVVDSGSVDGTLAVAEGRAHISHNTFISFAQQRNWAIDNCSTKYEWLLFLDADERATPEFQRELIGRIQRANAGVGGFFCCWKLMLENRWIKRSDRFPRWQLRVLRKGSVRFVDSGHGQKEGMVTGELEYIKEPYLHLAYVKGWHDWFAKHNRYSTQEARERFFRTISFRDFFAKHASQRNIALKVFLTKTRFWPIARFLYCYFLRLGFLDGYPGLIYSINMMVYEYLIHLKYREFKREVREATATSYEQAECCRPARQVE